MSLEIRFPESISLKSKTTIEFNTSIVTAKNGKEQRNCNRNEARMVYDVSSGIKSIADLMEITKLFRLARGKALDFRYKDWLDYHVSQQQIAIGDGETREFQLLKIYSGSVDSNLIRYSRKITKPVRETVKLFLNGEMLVEEIKENLTDQSGQYFAVDYETGVVILASAPAVGTSIEASFEFDVPVRFDSDKLELNLDNLHSGHMSNIVLVEVL